MTTTQDDNDDDAATHFAQYIETACNIKDSWSRVPCSTCNASRYLYCPDCCEILIPQDDWPQCIRDGSLRPPFEIDFILDDRRGSASGVQVATILRATAAAAASTSKSMSTSYRLFDQALDDGIPNYENEEGTYFLFPDKTSVPLSSVVTTAADDAPQQQAPTLRKLVVLDCKWSKSSARLHPSLAHLPKVHLDHPPEQSYFWRWHAAGSGMLCTVEAIYFAAFQVAEHLQWSRQHQEQLAHLLWLFGLQRQVIYRRFEQQQEASSNDGDDDNDDKNRTRRYKIQQTSRRLPFTEDAKQVARGLRTLHVVDGCSPPPKTNNKPSFHNKMEYID